MSNQELAANEISNDQISIRIPFNIKKIGVVLLLIVAAFLIEIIGYTHWSNLGMEQTIQPTSAKWINGNYTIYYDMDSQYVQKAEFMHNAKTDIPATVSYQYKNSFGKKEWENKHDLILGNSKVDYVNIGHKVSIITITMNTENAGITNLKIANKFSMNWYRISFWIITLLTIFFLISYRRWIFQHIARTFVILAMVFGSFLIICEYPYFFSCDEHIHFIRAYSDSYYNDIDRPEIVTYDKLISYIAPNVDATLEEKDVYSERLDSSEIFSGTHIEKEHNFSINKGYFIQTLFTRLARNLGVPLSIMMMFGKFGSLVLYAGICYLAIRVAQKHKLLVACVSLLPTFITQGASYSYDAIVLAGMILATSIWITEMTSNEKISITRMILFVMSVFIASIPKAVYIPLLLLGFAFRKTKFASTKQNYLFKIGISIITFGMLLTFVAPTVSNPDQSGDERGNRGEDVVSIAGQMENIIQHPVEYGNMLVEFTVDNIKMALGIDSNNYTGYSTTTGGYVKNGIFDYLLLIILIIIALEGKKEIDVGSKIWSVLVTIGAHVLIVTALYISFTPVKYSVINGVQGRYYFPMMILLLALVNNKWIKVNVHKNALTFLGMSYLSFIFLLDVYKMIIVPYCI